MIGSRGRDHKILPAHIHLHHVRQIPGGGFPIVRHLIQKSDLPLSRDGMQGQTAHLRHLGHHKLGAAHQQRRDRRHENRGRLHILQNLGRQRGQIGAVIQPQGRAIDRPGADQGRALRQINHRGAGQRQGIARQQ